MSQTSSRPSDQAPVEAAGQMSHREVLEALSGLLLAMFVAMLSSTVVTNALPQIGVVAVIASSVATTTQV